MNIVEEVIKEMNHWYSFELTEEQAKSLIKKYEEHFEETLECVDTWEREGLGDILSKELSGMDWPMNGSDEKYKDLFYRKLLVMSYRKGYKMNTKYSEDELKEMSETYCEYYVKDFEVDGINNIKLFCNDETTLIPTPFDNKEMETYIGHLKKLVEVYNSDKISNIEMNGTMSEHGPEGVKVFMYSKERLVFEFYDAFAPYKKSKKEFNK